MNILLITHLMAIGIWVGVVAAEFAIEFDGMKDQESLIKASKMHYVTDLWIEVPAFTTVLVTGLLMLNESLLSGAFLAKIIFSILSIIFNVVCVYAVAKRRSFALLRDFDGMDTTNTAMRIGALVIPTFVIAFVLAIYLAF